MKIRAVEMTRHSIPLREAYALSSGDYDRAEIFTVVVRTERGEVGLGSAAPAPEVTGETATQCEAALRSIGSAILVGADIAALPALLVELGRALVATPAARAALDIALHDLVARQRGIPLVELFGRVHTALPTSVTIGILPAERAVERARVAVAAGFHVLKIKLGRSVDEDVDRLHRIRAAVGADVRLRTDPNAGYSAVDLTHYLAATRSLAIELCEQPLARGADGTLRALDAGVRAALAADESVISEADVASLITPPQPFGVWNLKLMKTGGLAPALRMASRAQTAGLGLMWGSNDESVISIAAALAAAYASPATRFLDLDGSFDLVEDVAHGGFTVANGILELTDEPGLGVHLKSEFR
ncbi:MAG: mandelate racemase/muconate lactonizing enzyme family protein [Planctomycetota bacterium]